ncbi:hypothetical protein LOZ07_004841 [Ophidiomyces ophidiicola]|nr:hypothetical protein LOZ07_004841 [Ophidiomyces ophidiicola]
MRCSPRHFPINRLRFFQLTQNQHILHSVSSPTAVYLFRRHTSVASSTPPPPVQNIYHPGFDVENLERYTPGGFHPTLIGDTFCGGRYTIVHKLGFGGYSTIWLARDRPNRRYVSLKILDADATRETCEDEILRVLAKGDPAHPGKRFIPRLLDQFDFDGPNGRHRCLVGEPAGWSMAKSKEESTNFMFPREAARSIAAQCLMGLSYLHANDVCHGDLHLHNLLLRAPNFDDLSTDELYKLHGEPCEALVQRLDGKPSKPHAPPHAVCSMAWNMPANAMAEPEIVISDYGTSFIVSQTSSPTLHTPLLYAPPEELFDDTIIKPTAADIWTLAVNLYDALGERPLFETFTWCPSDIIGEMVNMLGPPPEKWWNAWANHSELIKIDSSWVANFRRFNDPISRRLPKRIWQMGRGETPETCEWDVTGGEFQALESLFGAMLSFEPTQRPTAEQLLAFNDLHLKDQATVSSSILDINIAFLYPMAPKVAIVGAGLSGLTALKHCLEEGFNATVFETRHAIGGQWLFEEPDPVTGKTSTSIYPGVLLNSCRDTSFFSDFPIDPAQYPDYFGHLKMLRYLESYADHFGLREHIRFGTKILSCSQGKDGRWDVKIAQEGADTIEDAYDAVFACSGALYQPAVPEFEGLQAFKGRVFHSRTYRRPSGFEGKRIAIIGFGNSAADLSSELCCQASEVHLITRRGGWVIPRFFLGKPVEAYDNRVFETLLPHRFSQWCQTRITNHAQGKLPGAIQPEHGLMEANVTMRSDLVENIKTGRIIPHRAGVERITETSMVLTDGVSIEVDVIICCTGYHLSVPYVPEESYRMKYNEILNTSNSMDLYKLVASPDFPNLFFIGFVELAGPVIPVSEAQVRWATSVIAGRVNLPSASNMYASIARFQGHIASRFVKSDRHAVTIRYLPYCDDLLKDIGANPTFFRLLSKIMTSNPIAATRLLMAVYLGVNSPAQYRLFGHRRKANLASAILLRIAREAGELSDKEKEYLELDSQQRAQ